MEECAEEVGFSLPPTDFICRGFFTTVRILQNEIHLSDTFVHRSPDWRNATVCRSPCAIAHGVRVVGAVGYFFLVAGTGEVIVPVLIGVVRQIRIGACKESPGVKTIGEHIVQSEVLVRSLVQELFAGNCRCKSQSCKYYI